MGIEGSLRSAADDPGTCGDGAALDTASAVSIKASGLTLCPSSALKKSSSQLILCICSKSQGPSVQQVSGQEAFRCWFMSASSSRVVLRWVASAPCYRQFHSCTVHQSRAIPFQSWQRCPFWGLRDQVIYSARLCTGRHLCLSSEVGSLCSLVCRGMRCHIWNDTLSGT